MRIVSNTVRTMLNSMNHLGDMSSTCKVVLVEVVPGIGDLETTIPNIVNVNIATSESNFSNTASITLNNVNPSNLLDFGYFTPHRSDTAHNKPQNSWFKKIVPNARIRIYMGYGDELDVVFYGFIDSVTPEIDDSNSLLNITCRDTAKLLLDKTCNSYNTVEAVKSWSIIYPIDTEIQSVYLTSTNTDPMLEDIVIDICRRAGFSLNDIVVDLTGILLSETTEGFFEFDNVTWDQAINAIKDLTMFEFWAAEDGKVHFQYPQDKVVQQVNEQVWMFGTSPQELGNWTAVKSSLVVKRMSNPTTIYTVETDYTFNPITNTITRVATGTIPLDEWVLVTYSYVDWIFVNGLNIIKLPLSMSHDKIYGKIRVSGSGGIGGGIEATVNVSSDFKLWDGSEVWEDKILSVTNENLFDEAACLALATRMKKDMLERYTSISLSAIPLPALQLKDVVQVVIYGMIGESYIITGQSLTYTADSQTITHEITAHHYSYVGI